jgi:hypothetical protein
MKVLYGLAAFLMSSATAFAGAIDPPPDRVPEIEVMAGLGAVGLVGALAALIWERRK